jgi:hypothetical protein
MSLEGVLSDLEELGAIGDSPPPALQVEASEDPVVTVVEQPSAPNPITARITAVRDTAVEAMKGLTALVTALQELIEILTEDPNTEEAAPSVKAEAAPDPAPAAPQFVSSPADLIPVRAKSSYPVGDQFPDDLAIPAGGDAIVIEVPPSVPLEDLE